MNARDKAHRLIERAVHPKTPEAEAFASAMAACKLIAQHDLLADPIARVADKLPDDLREHLDAVRALYEGLTNPKVVQAAKRLGRRLRRS